ncbi:hypothetical protein ACHAXA_009756 [Cyclostephanos tholiformis]|uniref:Uncharacterized protein n=1 Tax=Cyclostephanos tholiformis TaxID=382380 RepID=A0ABD3SGW2_9STRA
METTVVDTVVVVDVENNRDEELPSSSGVVSSSSTMDGVKPMEKTTAAFATSIEMSHPPSPHSRGRCRCLLSMWDYGEPEAFGYAVLVMGESEARIYLYAVPPFYVIVSFSSFRHPPSPTPTSRRIVVVAAAIPRRGSPLSRVVYSHSARGAAIMSFVLLNVALVELATEAAGCETGSMNDECDGEVYGLDPVSLISGVPVIAGLLGAFLMPMIGVVLDFTSYRRFVGIASSAIFTIVQAVQISVGERTWFAMTILQSIAGFCFTIVGVTNYAYLPEICDVVGRARHARYTSRYVAKQFVAMTVFMVLTSGLSFALGISGDSVKTARLSQGLISAILCVLFAVGWRLMPSRNATRDLPPGVRGVGMLAHGIRQNVRTIMSIHRVYKKGLRWYLLATMFANATVTAVTSTSVVYLSAEMGMNAVDVSMFMLVVLVGTIAGTMLALLVLKRVNPIVSWQYTMLYICAVLVIGSQTLGGAASKYLSIIWGFFVGVGLGWFYPAENLLFSCILPKGQEAEIAGFRMYCTVILAWFTPLVFGILVQKGYDPKWGMTFIGCFILIPAAMLRFCAGTWEEILQESGRVDSAGPEAGTSSFVMSFASSPVSPDASREVNEKAPQ